MTKIISIAGAALLGAFALGSVDAGATAVFGAQYQGVVLSGYDETGLFGTAGADLTGDTYLESFSIDTGLASDPATQTSTFEKELGGSQNIDPATISATITINGKTESVGGLTAGTAFIGLSPIDNTYEVYDVATDSSTTRSAPGPSATTTSITNSIQGGIQTSLPGVIPSAFGSYAVSVNNTTIRTFDSSFSFVTNVNGVDTVDTIGTLGVASATPELSTWLMMVLGIGAIGLYARYSCSFRNARLALVF